MFHLRPQAWCRRAKGSKLRLWELAARRQHVLTPLRWLRGTRALARVLLLDCRFQWNMPEETPKARVPFRLPPLPLCPGPIPVPATPLCGGCCHHRRGDPEEGSWRRHPGPSRRASRRAATSLGCSRCSFSARGPAWIWRLPAGAEGSRPPGPRGRAQWLAPPPTRLSPNSPPRDPGCSGFGHVAAAQVTRPEGAVSTVPLYLLFCIGADGTCSAVEGVCCFVPGVQQHDALMHSRGRVLFWVLFSYSLRCSVEYGPLSYSAFLLIVL